MILTERSIFSVSSAPLRSIFEGFPDVLEDELLEPPTLLELLALPELLPLPEPLTPAVSAEAKLRFAVKQAPRMQQIFRTLLGLTMLLSTYPGR
jgi:hypothetical protein